MGERKERREKREKVRERAAERDCASERPETMSSDSDDDLPLARRLVPIAKPKIEAKTEEEPPAAAAAAVKTEAKPVTKLKKEVKESIEKKKASKSNGAAKKEQQNGKKREKKVYDMPGQTRETPEENDPIRKFYESLSTQKPASEMAQFWLLQHGLLPRDVAEKVKLKKQKQVAGTKKKRGASQASATSVPKGAKRNEKEKGNNTNGKDARGRKKAKKERDVPFLDGGL